MYPHTNSHSIELGLEYYSLARDAAVVPGQLALLVATEVSQTDGRSWATHHRLHFSASLPGNRHFYAASALKVVEEGSPIDL